MEKFNQEQLMLYLYGEASPILKLAIDNALKDDSELQKEMNMLKRTKKQMDELKKKGVSPSQRSIDAILSYSKNTSKKK